jgi:hypothetical protein
MIHKTLSILIFSAALLFIGCEGSKNQTTADTVEAISFEQEKTAILQTLNQETVAAFSRDYNRWKEKWIHEPFVTKTYIDYPENHFTETLGWGEVDGFVREFFDKHPNPEPIPALLDNVDVRLYGTGAWVSFMQNDSIRGLKRETRLMEKVNGQWKIAGMHTTIYGFEE